MEFSRGSEHGGFKRAFEHLNPQVLADGNILYIDVPWEESLRKNRKRFNPEKPDSILEHGLSDEKLTRLYQASDWAEVSAANEQFISIQGRELPYVSLDNHDDVTTPRGPELGLRLEKALDRLWKLSPHS